MIADQLRGEPILFTKDFELNEETFPDLAGTTADRIQAHHSLTRFVNLTKELAALLREEGRIRVSLSFCDTAFGGDSAKPRCVDSNAIILRIRKDAGGRQVRPR